MTGTESTIETASQQEKDIGNGPFYASVRYSFMYLRLSFFKVPTLSSADEQFYPRPQDRRNKCLSYTGVPVLQRSSVLIVWHTYCQLNFLSIILDSDMFNCRHIYDVFWLFKVQRVGENKNRFIEKVEHYFFEQM